MEEAIPLWSASMAREGYLEGEEWALSDTVIPLTTMVAKEATTG